MRFDPSMREQVRLWRRRLRRRHPPKKTWGSRYGPARGSSIQSRARRERSLPDQSPIMSFRLPNGKTDQVYQVRLADGRIVYRSAEELEELPAGERGEVIGRAPAEQKGT